MGRVKAFRWRGKYGIRAFCVSDFLFSLFIFFRRNLLSSWPWKFKSTFMLVRAIIRLPVQSFRLACSGMFVSRGSKEALIAARLPWIYRERWTMHFMHLENLPNVWKRIKEVLFRYSVIIFSERYLNAQHGNHISIAFSTSFFSFVRAKEVWMLRQSDSVFCWMQRSHNGVYEWCHPVLGVNGAYILWIMIVCIEYLTANERKPKQHSRKILLRSSFALNFMQMCRDRQTLDKIFECFPSSSSLTAKFKSSEKLSQQFTVC